MKCFTLNCRDIIFQSSSNVLFCIQSSGISFPLVLFCQTPVFQLCCYWSREASFDSSWRYQIATKVLHGFLNSATSQAADVKNRTLQHCIDRR